MYDIFTAKYVDDNNRHHDEHPGRDDQKSGEAVMCSCSYDFIFLHMVIHFDI